MKAHILIVDEDETFRLASRRHLGEKGYKVTGVEDFDQAFELLDRKGTDLIFADIPPNQEKGLEFLARARQTNNTCPVVVVTDAPSIKNATKAIRQGFYDYIAKPLSSKALLRTTQKALEFKSFVDEKQLYQASLEAIFRSVKSAIISVNQDLKLVTWNAAAKKLCPFAWQHRATPVDQKGPNCSGDCLKTLKSTLSAQEPRELRNFRCNRADRSQQTVSVSTSPLWGNRGEFLGAMMVVRDETRLDTLERNLKERTGYHRMVGNSPQMQEIYSLVERLAEVPTTVLVNGESGTGKELIAEALHFQGPRRNGPLVKVNCAALTENLLETELFGHVKGAFSGAIRDNAGRFERANGGTIFLDEVGDISPALQVRLLRVLQEKTIERVGDSTPIRVDVRVVAATNQDLAARIEQGQFREDLFYRLKVVKIEIPPLRKHRTDIPLLVDHFIGLYNRKLHREVAGVTDEVQRLLMNYPWPGNVREFEHVIEHALILCHESFVGIEHLPADLVAATGRPAGLPAAQPGRVDGDEALRRVLAQTGGNKTKAARLLGISRRTLYRQLERYKILP